MFTGMSGLLSWSKCFCRLEPHFVLFCSLLYNGASRTAFGKSIPAKRWTNCVDGKNGSVGFFLLVYQASDWTYDVNSLWKNIVCPIGLLHVGERRFLHHCFRTSKSQYLYNRFIFDKISLFAFNHPEFCSETCILIQCQRRIRLFNGNHQSFNLN